MLNYSHFRATIPPHTVDISSSVTVCFAHSPLSLRLPLVRSLSLLSWSFAHCLSRLYFVNPSLFLCLSSQLTFCSWRLSIYTPQVTTFPGTSHYLSKEHLKLLQECICSERIFDDLVTCEGPKWIHHLALIWGDQLYVSKWKGPGIKRKAGC